MFQPCGNPECEYPANPDPEVSVGFCCEKCEGRAKGEEWAMSGKKKHTAYCTSKMDDFSYLSGGGGGGGGGPPNVWGKCKNPDCYYMKNSDPSISREFCCEKCEGRFKGEDWAEGGKAHYKNCEKIEAGSAAGGYGPALGGFGGWGDDYSVGGWGGPYSAGPFGGMAMMKGKGKCGGGFKGSASFRPQAGPEGYDPETEAQLDRWVSAKRQKDFGTADTIRSELRARGIEPEDARPPGYTPPQSAPQQAAPMWSMDMGMPGMGMPGMGMPGMGTTRVWFGATQKYDPETEAQLDQWVSAKRQKDFATADAIRDELRARGIEPADARPKGWTPGS